jgi:predicted metal-dependent peptidase
MADINDSVVQMIVAARVAMLFRAPFFGSLATRLNLVDASKWCESVATDGKHLYYNREFIKKVASTSSNQNKASEELMFIVAHLVLHCAYDHLGRRGSRIKEIWDNANDYIVNYTLVKENIGKMPPNSIYSEKFTDEMSSEEVYELLKKNSVQIKMPLDSHLDMDGSDGEDGDGDGQGQVTVTIMGDENGPPQITEEDLQQIRNEMKAAMISAAHASPPGSVPMGIRRLIDEFTQPIMDWRTLLEMHIQSSIKDDFTFDRPSRRSWNPYGDVLASMIMPGQKFKDTVEVAVAIDTSGSMTDEMLRDFLSEVKGIMETFDDFTLWIWTFDTRVYNPKKFTPNNLDEIFSYDPKGGGGTMFECNFAFMREPLSVDPDLEIDVLEPKKWVCFTDGFPNSTWGDPDYCDTLFVIHGSTTIVAPYGLTAYYQKQ